MIELKNISYSYSPDQELVRDLNIRINSGECLLLCGKSGSGKTTVSRIINNLIPRFYENGQLQGDVLIDGQNTKDLQMYQLSEIIGAVFQNPKTQFFHTNSDAEIVVGLENAGVAPEKIRQRFGEVVEDLEIENLTDRNMFSLSGGEKQIIAFASIYAINPQVYILDELTANIDQRTIAKVCEIIKKLKAMGRTVIICEHRLYFLRDLVDRALYIDNGVIQEEFSPGEFFALDNRTRIAMGLRSLESPNLHACNNGHTPTDPTESALVISDLTCCYGKKAVFNRLNLSANPGEIVGITGDNGAGKTTLVRCLAGLHKETTGTVKLDGKMLNLKQRQKISSMVMQDVNYQLFTDSVVEECRLGNDASDTAINTVLKELALDGFEDAHPMVLSGGQKQRLVIANSVLSDKKILIFDEPTSGLDYEGMLAVSRQLKKLSEDGHFIFLVTHDIELINETCTSVFELEND